MPRTDVLDALFLLFFFFGKNWSILWGRLAGRVIQWRKTMQQARSLSARLEQGPAVFLITTQCGVDKVYGINFKGCKAAGIYSD